MARTMLTEQKNHWGLGFAVSAKGDELLFGHGGDDEGFATRLEAYMGSGQGVAIMSNGTGGDQLLSELMCAIAQEYGWPDFHPHEHLLAKVPPHVLSSYAGTYQAPDGGKLKVRVKNGRAYVSGFVDQSEEIFPESTTQFFLLSDPMTFEFSAHGPVTTVTIHDGEDLILAKRISENQ